MTFSLLPGKTSATTPATSRRVVSVSEVTDVLPETVAAENTQRQFESLRAGVEARLR